MRLPEWLKTKDRADLHPTKQLLRQHGLTTVCEEARCPNRGACFAKPTAAFMILGSRCTRNCGFCAVTSAAPAAVDSDEPKKVAEASAEMGLRYVVITSVTRDDLSDGGAGHFAETVLAVRRRLPGAKIEVLTPDFRGDAAALATVLGSRPDVFNHNIETAERLYGTVRPGADYRRSLHLLEQAKRIAPAISAKSGFMLGLGERPEEVHQLLLDLRSSGCDIVTIGQYLRPTRNNLPVVEYVKPEIFEELRTAALGMGFHYVASGPLVRSSMNAEEMYAHV
ncbi:MAG: lipoyl synthase [Nitrospiraceae bacterium]|nr:lipoyl synthase [Nitrospiraceae bacterium]